MSRLAERTLLGRTLNDPPRNTRRSPDTGPVGSMATVSFPYGLALALDPRGVTQLIQFAQDRSVANKDVARLLTK